MTLRTPDHDAHQHLNYGLTCAEHDALAARADGRCEVCRQPVSDLQARALHHDHDHAVGPTAVRGLTCSRCNSLLAQVDAGLREPTEQETRYLRDAWYLLHPPSGRPNPSVMYERTKLLPRRGPVSWALDPAAKRRHDEARQRVYDHIHQLSERACRIVDPQLDALVLDALRASASPTRLGDMVGRARVRRLQQDIARGDHAPTSSS